MQANKANNTRRSVIRDLGLKFGNDDPLAAEKILGIDAMWGLWTLKSISERKDMANKIAACTTSGQICILMRQVRDEM